ncbi:MAG: hypothetical protein ACO38V_08155 [Phycisphaerales bacterium]
MTVSPEQLRQNLRAAPFKPFRIHLADGRQVDVPHPEFAWLVPTGRTIHVFSSADQASEQIDVPLILSLAPIDGSSTQAA